MFSLSLKAMVAAAALASSVAAAQVTEVRKYNEVRNPNTPVRGHAVVGVSIEPKGEVQEKPHVSILVRPGWRGQVVNIDVTTANGKVQGEALFEVLPGPGGAWQWEKLSVPRSHRNADPQGLTVGVQAPKDPTGAFYVAAWGDAPSPALDPKLQIWIYVNRGRAPAATLYWDVEAGQGRACIPLPSNQLRFNTVCEVKVSEVPASGKLLLVLRDGGSSQRQDVQLAW